MKHFLPPITCLLGCLLATLPKTVARADDVSMVRPFVDESTVLVVKLDPTRIKVSNLAKVLGPLVFNSEQERSAWIRQANQWLRTYRALTADQPFYATVGIPPSNKVLPIFLFLEETPEVDPKQFHDFFGKFIPRSRCVVRDGRIVTVPQRESALETMVPSPRKGLDKAFEAVGDYPIQILVLPPDYLRRTVVELMPELPGYLGEGPSRLLTEGLVWAAIGVDFEKLEAELIVQSASAEAARDLAEHLPRMIRGGFDAMPKNEKPPREMVDALIPLLKPQVDGDRITLRLDNDMTSTIAQRIIAMIETARERARIQADLNQFKMLGLAMHNHHDVHGVFPPRNEVRDKDGQSGLSWRVHILPYHPISNKRLFDQFHLDEPWDSPHNKKLIAKMPDIYKSRVHGIKPGHTTFLAPSGDDTIFGGSKAIRMREITDSTTYTIMLIEVKPELAVPWTAPQDYQFDPKDPGRGLQIRTPGKFLTLRCDGSVGSLPTDLEPKLLLWMFQKSDGQPVDWKVFYPE